MKTPHYLALLALLTPVSLLPIGAQAMGSKPAESPKASTAQVHKGQGTLNRMDLNTAKVNITHAPIPSLGWSTMTMDFQVKDKTQLSKLKAGQKVSFELLKGSDGQYLITRITPANP